ncbi:MAG: M48 family metallopeptidase [Planctomycetaceae bacterium]|jgi:STE24 endopeptidase
MAQGPRGTVDRGIMLNGYFFFILSAVVGIYLLDLIGRLFNLSALRSDLPDDFSDVYDAEEYARSQEYTREETWFANVQDSFGVIVFLAFWWSGGFAWLDGFVRGFAEDAILRGLLFTGVLYLVAQILAVPFDLYSTFVIEEKYGFNKMTWWTFTADIGKGLLLSLLLGAPLLALVLFLFESIGELAWVYGWVAVSGFSLLLTYLAPPLILPLFNKFTPLEEGELKDSIRAMAEKCEFPLTEVCEIDGSRRSTKANAFFTGLGRNRKIALFDTLIENHSVRELVAVLAHEIGHYRKKHILQAVILGVLRTGVLFFMFGLFLNNRGLFDAFAVEHTSIYVSLVLFAFLFQPLSKLLDVGMMTFSRRNEYEADAYAADVTGHPEDLISGLKRLSKDNLANLTPHPFFVFMNYSHPPTMKRIRTLAGAAQK